MAGPTPRAQATARSLVARKLAPVLLLTGFVHALFFIAVFSEFLAATWAVCRRVLSKELALFAFTGRIFFEPIHTAVDLFGSVRHTERVRRKLLQLACDYGRVTGDGVKLDLPLRHALLGEMVGSERETVTRAIDQLESAGFLSREGFHYRLHVAPDALAR